jgi:hypothetical protein
VKKYNKVQHLGIRKRVKLDVDPARIVLIFNSQVINFQPPLEQQRVKREKRQQRQNCPGDIHQTITN